MDFVFAFWFWFQYMIVGLPDATQPVSLPYILALSHNWCNTVKLGWPYLTFKIDPNIPSISGLCIRQLWYIVVGTNNKRNISYINAIFVWFLFKILHCSEIQIKSVSLSQDWFCFIQRFPLLTCCSLNRWLFDIGNCRVECSFSFQNLSFYCCYFFSFLTPTKIFLFFIIECSFEKVSAKNYDD